MTEYGQSEDQGWKKQFLTAAEVPGLEAENTNRKYPSQTHPIQHELTLTWGESTLTEVEIDLQARHASHSRQTKPRVPLTIPGGQQRSSRSVRPWHCTLRIAFATVATTFWAIQMNAQTQPRRKLSWSTAHGERRFITTLKAGNPTHQSSPPFCWCHRTPMLFGRARRLESDLVQVPGAKRVSRDG